MKAALPLRSSVVLSTIPSAFTVSVSLLPLAVIVVLAVPVVMLMPLSFVLSPAVTVSEPARAVALMSPTRFVTTSLELPLRVKAVLLSSAVASVLIVSDAAAPAIVVAALPVVMLMPLSAASAVDTFRVPVRLAPVRLPTRLVTTCLAAPKKLSRVFWPSLVASVVTVSLLLLPVIVVAPLPVVTPMALSVASAVVIATVPEVPPANTEPVRLVTVKSLVLALPERVRLPLSARLAALTVRS